MITLKNLTLRRGAKVVLDAVSLTIHAAERVGLVGRNGAGKSSLFGLLTHELHEDAGELVMPPSWRVAQVEQHMAEGSVGATDFVLAGDVRLAQLQAALAVAEAAGDGMAIAELHAQLADAGAHDARARAQSLILGLGFAPAQLDAAVGSFSGGWRMRLQLARALMAPSDLLLLDEPTNHLDMDALVWLQEWLARYTGTLILISHDRDFLDATTRVTVHLEGAKLTRWGGNYSRFEELRAQQLSQQAAAWQRQQEKIAQLQSFIDRFKAKATKARQAQSRVKQIERMEKIAPVLAEADFHFQFQPPASLPNPMLVLRDAALGYGGPNWGEGDKSAQPMPKTPYGALGGRDDENPSEIIILRGVMLNVMAGQRIGILGANGQGKSTLVKTIAGALPLRSGQITQGKGLRIGYFAQQELDVLRPEQTPLQHMTRLALADEQAAATGRSREQELRTWLGSFNFSGDAVAQTIGSMSGGEKARLVLAMLVWQRPNLLVLDEPTNHLDLITREALALALANFEGAMLLVSHDRHLLRAACEQFWLVAGGQVQPYEGSLQEYERYLLEAARQRREAMRKSSPTAANARENATNLGPKGIFPCSDCGTLSTLEAPKENSKENAKDARRAAAAARQQLAERLRPLQKELAAVQARMAALETQKTDLETKLCAPPAGFDIAEAGRALKAACEQLAAHEERWLVLTEQIEALKN